MDAEKVVLPDEDVKEVASHEVVKPEEDVQEVVPPNAEVPAQLVDPHPRTLQQFHQLVAQEEHLNQPSPPPLPNIEKIKFVGSLPALAPESRELTPLFSHKYFNGNTAKPEKDEWFEYVHVPKFNLKSLN